MATFEELLDREDVQAAITAAKSNPQNAGKRFRPIDTPAGFIVVKNPSSAQWTIMSAMAWDDDKATASKAMRGLILGCIVHPDKAIVAQMSEEYAGIWDNPHIVKEVRVHCGHAMEANSKK